MLNKSTILVFSSLAAKFQLRRVKALRWLDYRSAIWRNRVWRQKGWLGTAVIAIAMASSFYCANSFENLLQTAIGEWSAQGDPLSTFRPLSAQVGGALVGATAMAFSVVMLAVQINFARMPYGLFRRLSSDVRLLAIFAATPAH